MGVYWDLCTFVLTKTPKTKKITEKWLLQKNYDGEILLEYFLFDIVAIIDFRYTIPLHYFHIDLTSMFVDQSLECFPHILISL